jgi:DNA invertase Pin-like site-specific DNA recombinase
MTTALYLRQSKDQNGTGLAIDRQRQDCQKLARQRKWGDVVEYVDNDVSASSKRPRPAYQRMLADIEAGKVRAVVCWDLDRLHRRPIELEHFIELADHHHLSLATVSGDHDLSTGDGRMFARIKGAVAREEMDQKSKRQKRQAQQAADLGKPHIAPRAFGYEPDGMTVREDEAEALRAAYRAILAGATLVSLCRDLTAASFTTPAGKPFRHSGIRAMLLNPRNIAIRTYWYEEVGPAQWPAIIDENTFRAVQSILKDPGRRKNNNTGTARRWLLGGLGQCGVCNDGTTMKVSYRGDVDRLGNAVRVYRCRQHPHLSRSADWVDWRVTEHVITRLSEPDAADLLVDDQREDLAELREEVATLHLRLTQLGEDFAEGLITRETLRSGTERIKARLADLDERMAHVDRAPVLADLVTANDVRAAWEGIGLDRQRAVIDLLYKVTLMPRSPGRYATPLESVIMEPKID